MASLLCWSARLRLTIAAICLLALCQQVQAAYNVEYCSTINTADTPKNTSLYQTNSLCYNFCSPDSYAFAVVQYQGCWCSNYVPATTTTGCTMNCPGWPDEKCGNTEGGLSLYGYVELSASPSGTKGASAASSSDSAQATVISTLAAIISTATTTDPPSSSSSSSSSTSTQKSSSPTTISSVSSTWTPTPVTSIETVTGLVRTFTVTPTVPPNSQATNSITKSDKGGGGGLGTGGAVGLTIGLVALVAIISAIIFFCLRKRRQERASSLEDLSRRDSTAGFGTAAVPSRTMSENSRYVLGTDGRRVVENWEPGGTEEVRRSRLMPVDQRLDPFSPVYQRGDNKSRESVNTIRDDHDYSRRVASGPGILRATNPD